MIVYNPITKKSITLSEGEVLFVSKVKEMGVELALDTLDTSISNIYRTRTDLMDYCTYVSEIESKARELTIQAADAILVEQLYSDTPNTRKVNAVKAVYQKFQKPANTVAVANQDGGVINFEFGEKECK